MGQDRDGIFLGGIGSDVFGEEGTARQLQNDIVNVALRTKYLTEWFNHARQNNQLHPEFEDDIKQLRNKKFIWTPLYVFIGVAVAGVLFNPNYTSRNSFYLRKFTPLIFGTFGYQFGHTQWNKHQTHIMMKNFDYYPYEVKRTLASKDFRYMVGFDFASAKFDSVSGKSI